MQSILAFLTLSLLCISCAAQKIVLSNTVSIEPPKKLLEADKNEISALVSKRFGKTKYLAKLIQNNPKKVYTIDDMVIFVNSDVVNNYPDFLKTYKMASDDVGLKIKGYSSKIENIGGRDVFVTDEVSEGQKLYRFTTVNRNEDFVVTGFIQYLPGQESKARTVLEDLIKGLKFDHE